MNEESVKNGMNKDDAPIWNLDTYETPISKNNNDPPRKKKYMRIILISIAMLIVLLSVSVVLAFKMQLPRRIVLWNPTEETIRNDVSTYLEERYDEKFVITNIIFPNFNYASYIITAYPEGKPQKSDYKITIHGWEKKGLIDYYDNYPVVKLIPELREYISDVVGDYFPENKVYVQSFHQEWIRGNIDKNITLDEFLNDIEGEWHSAGWYHVCISYDGSDDDDLLDKVNKLATYMAENKLSGLYFVEIVFNDYYILPDYFDDLKLERYGIDFINYCYVIDRYGNFDEETEVEAIGIK